MNNMMPNDAAATAANQRLVDALTRDLEAAPDIDSSAVNVSAEGDVVVLRGVVGSFAEKLAAVVLAWSVPGVASVDNKMTVRELDLEAANIPDVAILQEVGRALLKSAIVIDDLRFTVRQHVVTLHGNVRTQSDRIAARSAVQRSPGVHFVNNLIRVNGGRAHPEIEELDAASCLELLAGCTIGRLAVRDGDGADIFPVNFSLHDGDVYFRTAPGTKLMRLTAAPAVAFEADGHGPRNSWSVVIKGRAVRLNRDDEIAASGINQAPSAFPTDKFNYVRIRPEQLTGRRFRHLEVPHG